MWTIPCTRYDFLNSELAELYAFKWGNDAVLLCGHHEVSESLGCSSPAFLKVLDRKIRNAHAEGKQVYLVTCRPDLLPDEYRHYHISPHSKKNWMTHFLREGDDYFFEFWEKKD